ncbi:MAG: DNA primase [Janthinobacterium lividum]
MALPPAFLDELRARTPLSALVGRRVKLSKSGRNWKGCCPFHSEKSPSFYVYDDGFHCFGCGAHGDAISFLMQTAGASFPEAVEQLAGEAGLEVPKPSPRAVEAERQRLDLHDVLEAAQSSFARRLREKEGAPGLAYLRGRGLTDATIENFGLGWSGDGRGALTAELGRAGITPDRLLEAGLLRSSEDNGPARELYWGRVTFPIRDRRGRLISFGGRTLGDAKPKYINGPDTTLFSKRRNLYALNLAREGLRTGADLIVAEGYMDVIALHQAGFPGAVAPLGTALTEEQLEELWRLAPNPLLCFDGDAAGARAGARVAELCLPLLTPGRTLRFASLPTGEDPDSLARRGGKAAIAGLIAGARPLAEALYDFVREGSAGDSPEQRAAFRTRLAEVAKLIPDRDLASEYRSTLLNRYFESRRGPGAGGPRAGPGGGRRMGGWSGGRPGQPAPRPANFTRFTANSDVTQAERGRCLIAVLIRHPDLLHDTEEAFLGLELPPALDRVRDAILHHADHGTLDSAALVSHLHASDVAEEIGQILGASGLPLPDYARPDAMPAEAEAGWWHIFGQMNRGRLEEEWLAAGRAFAEQQDNASQRRLIALTEARANLSALEDADAEP